MNNNEIINHPDYYALPCGKQLEDFIHYLGLNFFEGSALKYLWRAGMKHGESREKDLNKFKHYTHYISEHRGRKESEVAVSIHCLKTMAENWK